MKQHLALKIVEEKRVMKRDVYGFISCVLLESDEKAQYICPVLVLHSGLVCCTDIGH
jgi:hypothetical protein